MKKISKFLSIILAIMMVVSTIPITSFGATIGVVDWEYTIISEEDKTAKLTKYTGSDSDVVTPTEIDGYSIVSIGEKAFYENDYIENVIISEGVTSTGIQVFYGCENLNSVSFPDGLETISSGMFSYSPRIRMLLIPDSVTTIESAITLVCLYRLVVLYSGTEEQWSEINIESGNSEITDAMVLYEVDNGIVSGECGTNAKWELDALNGVLTISGTGEMNDYKNSTYKAWYDLANLIETVVVDDGITYIGQNAFSGKTYQFLKV